MPLSITNYVNQVAAGQPKKPSPIHDALQAIQSWASAGLTTNDLAAAAGILLSQTVLGAGSAEDAIFNNAKSIKFKTAAGALDALIQENAGGDLLLQPGGSNRIVGYKAGVTAALAMVGSGGTNNVSLYHDNSDAWLLNSAGYLYLEGKTNINLRVNGTSVINLDTTAMVPQTDNATSNGNAGHRYSDTRSVLINGSSFLSEKKVSKWVDKNKKPYDFLAGLPRLIEFKWKKKNPANKGKTFFGFAADDLPKTIADKSDKSVNVLGAIAYSYGAIKQLHRENAALARRLKALEKKLAD